MNCPLCNSNNKQNKKLSNSQISICNDCSLNFIESKQDDNYYDGFCENFDLTDSKIDKLRDKQYELHTKYIQKIIPKGKILDVGCSSGELLKRISKEGNYELVGIDPDKKAIKNAQDKNKKIKFFESDLIKFDLENNFDAFVFRGTFQYLSYDLIKSLKKMRTIGKQNAKIIILSLPNSDSILYKILGDNWHMFHKLEHTLIFNRKSFLKLCDIFNFKLVECTYPYMETPYANPEKDSQDLIDLIKLNKEKSFPFWGNLMQVVLEIN